MSKRQVKSQASSERAAVGARSNDSNAGSHIFGGIHEKSSNLSYVAEPSNLYMISHPNVKITFKNLSKRDSTTKSKALEDLQSHLSSVEAGEEQLEDGVLEAWVGTFLRLTRSYTDFYRLTSTPGCPLIRPAEFAS